MPNLSCTFFPYNVAPLYWQRKEGVPFGILYLSFAIISLTLFLRNLTFFVFRTMPVSLYTFSGNGTIPTFPISAACAALLLSFFFLHSLLPPFLYTDKLKLFYFSFVLLKTKKSPIQPINNPKREKGISLKSLRRVLFIPSSEQHNKIPKRTNEIPFNCSFIKIASNFRFITLFTFQTSYMPA